jgi:hypothetical protein
MENCISARLVSERARTGGRAKDKNYWKARGEKQEAGKRRAQDAQSGERREGELERGGEDEAEKGWKLTWAGTNWEYESLRGRRCLYGREFLQ